MIPVPNIPPVPPTIATEEEQVAYAREIYRIRTIIAANHAEAQDNTASAMGANVVAQHAVAAAFALPAPEPTLAAEKRAMVLTLLANQARGTRTIPKFVADCVAEAEAIFAAYPKNPPASTSGGALG